MNSAVKEAHRLVDEAASHIASLKTILDHGSLPPLADSLDAEPQHDDPTSAVMSVAERQDDDPNKASFLGRHRAGASSPNDFHTADGLRHRAGASSPNDFQKALAEYKRQNRVTSRS
jgi:hypothetical protein